MFKDVDYLKHSPAARQWKTISVKPHHGIAVPLFSIHSAQSFGVGEYSDLRLLIDWCTSIGFDVIQLLPLNDCGPGTSPYSAISAFALNPLFLGLSSLPFVNDVPELHEELKTLPKFSYAPRVDYARVREHKEKFLHHYFHCLANRIMQGEDYQAFVENASWLRGYAVFKILKHRHQWTSWLSWPEHERQPTEELFGAIIAAEQEQYHWHCLLQFLCDKQLKSIKKYARDRHLLLMGDIPILIDKESADVWQHQDLFDLQYSAGAPPDLYSENGQNWAFPIYRWTALEDQNYQWWTHRLQWASRYYHLYRIDHIVGFFRIWAIPEHYAGKEGHFIPQDASTWIDQGQKILLMMLNASEMLPIGEDLGIVPSEVKTCINALGICGTRVMRWERKWKEDGQYLPPEDYAVASMTTVSTHDSETLQHWWKAYPMEAQLLAHFKGWSYQTTLSHTHHKEILWDSHHTRSLFHINLLQEYLTLIPGLSWPHPEDDRINIPGLISDKNWTYRFRPSVEEMIADDSLKHLMQEIIA